MAGTLRALGLRAAGANYENIKRSIKRLSIDTTHWTGKGHLKGTTNPWARKAAHYRALEDRYVAIKATN
jgi:hypothetical protein